MTLCSIVIKMQLYEICKPLNSVVIYILVPTIRVIEEFQLVRNCFFLSIDVINKRHYIETNHQITHTHKQAQKHGRSNIRASAHSVRGMVDGREMEHQAYHLMCVDAALLTVAGLRGKLSGCQLTACDINEVDLQLLIEPN